jgi:hypothetical protein
MNRKEGLKSFKKDSSMKKIVLSLMISTSSIFCSAQNVGIGTTTPVAKLHVADSNVLFSSTQLWYLPFPPGNPPMSGEGVRMMWYPDKAAFRVGAVSSTAWDKDSLGKYSFAAGLDAMAKGDWSVALGVNSNSNNWYSVTAGGNNTANGIAGVAIGYNNISRANYGVVIGNSLISKSEGETVVGSYNDTSNISNGSVNPTDRIFQVGNGSAFGRGNAFTVLRNSNTGIGVANPRYPLSFTATNGNKISLYDDGNPSQLHFGLGIFSNQLLQFYSATVLDDIAFGIGNSSSFTERMRIKGNGKVGIGTSSPLARLHVADSSVVFLASGQASSSPGNPPVSGEGRRMMWYADKASFRAGYVNTSSWDRDSIGDYSTALGINNKAKGYSSFAVGNTNSATGFHAIAMGLVSNATGNNSIAMGEQVTASGDNAVSFGFLTTASGNRSLASGYVATATGFASTAIGFGPAAPGNYSVSIGSNTQAVGGASLSMGDNSIARGNNAISIGAYTIARSDYSFVTGKYNDTTATNRIFEIGNGTANNVRNNAVTILQNGSALFTAPASLPGTPDNPPAIGAGNRMMWYADKASFRAGNIINDSWDKDKTGNVSFAAGSNTQASGITSTAFGNFAFATGDISFAAGNSVFAKAKMATAFGTYNDNTDNPNASVEASTDRIFQIGNGSGNLSRSNAVTILRNSNFGIGTINPVKQAEIVGPASGTPVTLVIANRGGFGPAAMEFVSDYSSPSQWRPGYIRSNDLGGFTGALEFYTNGTGAGNLYGNVKGFEVRNGVAYTATGTVSSFSDARIKKNIEPFTYGLEVITKINPVSFNYNNLSPFITDKKQIGIIAQELEKAAPYLVETNNANGITDLRSVNNQAYTFLLINAVKELQQLILEQQKQIDQLKKMIKK